MSFSCKWALAMRGGTEGQELAPLLDEVRGRLDDLELDYTVKCVGGNIWLFVSDGWVDHDHFETEMVMKDLHRRGVPVEYLWVGENWEEYGYVHDKRGLDLMSPHVGVELKLESSQGVTLWARD